MIWPEAIYVGKVLRRMPSELLIPELARVIEENHCDQTWLQWICLEIISSLKREELADLKVPLMEFIYDVKSELGVSALNHTEVFTQQQSIISQDVLLSSEYQVMG